jgi:hypothetical protein
VLALPLAALAPADQLQHLSPCGVLLPCKRCRQALHCGIVIFEDPERCLVVKLKCPGKLHCGGPNSIGCSVCCLSSGIVSKPLARCVQAPARTGNASITVTAKLPNTVSCQGLYRGGGCWQLGDLLGCLDELRRQRDCSCAYKFNLAACGFAG